MKKSKYIVGSIIIFAGIIILFGINWVINNFGLVSIDKIIFHLKVPLKGTSNNFINSFIIKCLIPSIIVTLLCTYLAVRNFKYTIKLLIKFFKYEKEFNLFPFYMIKKHYIEFSIVFILISIINLQAKLDIKDYIVNSLSTNTFFEKNYVNPKDVKLTFPDEKRNLIYIYVESLEVTYTSKINGGAFKDDYMPELTKFAKKNTHFSNTDKLGGALELPSTGWTIAGMVAQTAGIPLKIPIEGNSYGEYSSFLPGAYTLGDILKKEGYNQMLMIGSDATFGGRKNYFTQHGNYYIWDYYTAIEKNKIPKGYFIWWGYEDNKLFTYAKEEIEKLSSKNEPFNFTLLTVSTHHIGGYLEESCEMKYPEQFASVIACSSREIYNFINWIKKQDFYENTTIVIVGDHLSMDPYFFQTINDNYTRRVFNIFINPAINTNNTKKRKFSTMDLFPTTLASMGVIIEGNKLALGTNLFSDDKTLIEEYGYDNVFNELQKKSYFYYNNILYK